jgi:hypothetical protein
MFLRLFVLLLGFLTVVYVCVYFYLLAAQREKLADAYPDAATPAERDRFVEAQVQTFAARLRPRLAGIVYVVPSVLLWVYIWATN